MDYYGNIKKLIEDNIVLKKKNRMVEENHTLKTYFEVGKNIVEAQGGEKRAKYGDNLIKDWSIKLSREYGKGYDYTNLSRMRKLYLTFRKVATVWQQLSWSNFKILLPIENQNKMNYYINMCIKNNLSVRKLQEAIKNSSYERLENKENIEIIADKEEKLEIKDMLKNPILIKSGEGVDKLTEKALKKYILENIEEIFMELGTGFAYIGSEVRLGPWYCDLLFFNVEAKCYIVVEVKIRMLRNIDIGQIQSYMNYIDMNIKK